MSLVRIRCGIPRFARKLEAGEPVTIVAYGTSMTLHSRCGRRLGGWYLERLVDAVHERWGDADLRLINSGLEGFTTWWAAHRVRTDVLPHRPDLVLLEFAHNDEGKFLPAIPVAIDGIVAQIREDLPECEIALVILQPAGEARNGPSEAMLAHERAADVYGFPSFDLATHAERLVEEGRATWNGDPATSLTFDGIHHAALSGELLGQPFADAFVELVRDSLRMTESRQVPSRSSPASRAHRFSLRPFLEGGWAIGPATEEIYCKRNIAAFVDEIAAAGSPGPRLHLSFTGTVAQVFALGIGGAVRIVADGVETYGRLSSSEPPQWTLVNLAADVSDARHDVELTVLEAPLVLGDLFVVGRLAT
ncbi:MAG: SGNH/GDSL hydrolase family protein [Candidatus Eremiobacteraeota bacterium]|nr:SGNH/GDSL hydrolase family protein [Candidatus Eremiobacteraeota bacterium]